MMTFLVTIHILVCVILVALVLIQDSKGGGVLGGQSTSNSVLGATGATTLAGTRTKVMAGLLGTTCLLIAIYTAKSQKSVVDGSVMSLPAATATTETAAPAAATSGGAATETAPAAAAPAAPAEPKK